MRFLNVPGGTAPCKMSVAETCVKEYAFSREEQDTFSLESYQRAQDAIKDGRFKKEIAIVEIAGTFNG